MIASQKYIEIYHTISSFYSKINSNLIKKEFIYSEKMSNSGNHIYDYTHSFVGKDFLINLKAAILVTSERRERSASGSPRRYSNSSKT